ncbi:unnamed protein product [Moneuplotes crassus]|uniref:Uncharacterized protein n=1 Tax=Euplotes crassus TaxID=5936 RepID=A0AAD1XLN6_EUPCR|nr:unnamed protein product [Moneuplotes crassus]
MSEDFEMSGDSSASSWASSEVSEDVQADYTAGFYDSYIGISEASSPMKKLINLEKKSEIVPRRKGTYTKHPKKPFGFEYKDSNSNKQIGLYYSQRKPSIAYKEPPKSTYTHSPKIFFSKPAHKFRLQKVKNPHRAPLKINLNTSTIILPPKINQTVNINLYDRANPIPRSGGSSTKLNLVYKSMNGQEDLSCMARKSLGNKYASKGNRTCPKKKAKKRPAWRTSGLRSLKSNDYYQSANPSTSLDFSSQLAYLAGTSNKIPVWVKKTKKASHTRGRTSEGSQLGGKTLDNS